MLLALSRSAFLLFFLRLHTYTTATPAIPMIPNVTPTPTPASLTASFSAAGDNVGARFFGVASVDFESGAPDATMGEAF